MFCLSLSKSALVYFMSGILALSIGIDFRKCLAVRVRTQSLSESE